MYEGSNAPVARPATRAWLHQVQLLRDLFHEEDDEAIVAPRGQRTAELLHSTLAVDLERPAVVCPERGISHHFMAAEARWVLTGDDRLSPVGRFAPQIVRFADKDPAIKKSDEGEPYLQGTRFFGAYGPRFVRQLPYVVRCLGEDRDSRQAVVSLWQESPPPTRDVPCTLTLTFSIRRGRLNCHVHMRSSDAWLGVPYDVFTFSAMTYRVGHELQLYHGVDTTPGSLFLTMASSHLYERNLEAAERVCADAEEPRACRTAPRAVSGLTTAVFHECLMSGIRHLLDGEEAHDLTCWRFWEADDA